MKTKRFFLFGLPTVLLALSLVASVSLMLAGCEGGNTPETGPSGSEDLELSGTIIISATNGGTTAATEAEAGDILYAVYSGGTEDVAYQWQKDGTAIDGATGSSYMPVTAGSYTVTVSATSYLSKTSAAVDVLDEDLPEVDGTIIISATNGGTTAATEAEAGDTLYAVYGGETGDVTYQWQKDGTAIDGATGDSFTPAEAGSYTVTVSAASHQSITSDAVAVAGGSVSPISITGAWNGTADGNVLTIGNTDWECVNGDGNYYKGTYAFEGNTGAFTITHIKESADSAWEPASGTGIGTVTGNILTIIFTWTSPFADTVSLMFNKPGGGTGGGGNGGNGGGGGPLTSIAVVAAQLAAATGGISPVNPVSLVITLDDLEDLTNGWRELLYAIQYANKYVALDLSACCPDDHYGEFDPDNSISTGKDKIVSLVLPNTATNIRVGFTEGVGYGATFKHFTALKSVSGSNITSMTSSNFPTSGESAFSGCTALETADFPKAETIGNVAFYNCPLTTVNLPKVETIGAQALDQWSGVIHPLAITFGSTAPTVGGMMFSQVKSSKTVTVRVPVGASGYDNTWQTQFTGGNSYIMLTIQYQ
ncbi:MAG: leucine-rich repeat domain-containing protein [Spirochaetaceae bacterium]|jgi:hypothetical protein|nr:leucine-rich repeat domain-containing protein [Spirochaetaceae bacterium]